MTWLKSLTLPLTPVILELQSKMHFDQDCFTREMSPKDGCVQMTNSVDLNKRSKNCLDGHSRHQIQLF